MLHYQVTETFDINYVILHLHLLILADSFIQSDLQMRYTNRSSSNTMFQA